MSTARSLLELVLALVLAPLLPGLINRVKAKFAGRQGKPLFQLYYDLRKLLGKGAVYPECSTWVFRMGPLISLACLLVALTLTPFGSGRAVFAFGGDFVLMAYVLALSRFATMLAALDTGSAFEGMGASREGAFGALAEPVFLLAVLVMGFRVGEYSLSGLLGKVTLLDWQRDWAVLLLLGVAFFQILILENCRIPADDPNTHLELTMIHEVMILDQSGPDLAFAEYAAALKLWLFSAVTVGALLPRLNPALDMVLFPLCICVVALAAGVVESVMARLRMARVPQIPALAGVLAALAFLLLWR